MADSKISQLTEETTPAAGDYLELLDSSGGDNKKVSVQTLAELLLPRRIEIVPWSAPPEVISGTYAKFTSFTGYTQGAAYNPSVANGNYFGYKVALAAGTWRLDVIYRKSTDGGIWQPKLDGTNVGSGVDSYAAATAYNNLHAVTGISVTAAGMKELRLELTGKHASSTAYLMVLQSITLARTA